MMFRRLGMERNDIGTSLSKGLNLRFRMLRHQMDIKHSLGRFAQAFDNRRTQRDVRHKGAIHYIDMNIFCPSIGDFFYLISQMSKISRQDGGCNLNHLYSFFRAIF